MLVVTCYSATLPPRQLYIVLLIFCYLTIGLSWKTDRRPRVFGDKLPRKFLLPANRQVQKKIVVYHNFFRAHVQPTASDMLAMTWHKGAARAAQQWADQCLHLTHDSPSGRWLDLYGSCGQNIFISTQQVPWFFAIKTWFLERHNFTYGSDSNSLADVGHYTQLVWASTHKVGCGFQECRHPSGTGRKYYSYVCNYCPTGNLVAKLGEPYTRGEPCTGCRQHCRKKRLCTNSCGAADLWANCEQLHRAWPHWLCGGTTRSARERHDHCRATCACTGKIK